MPSRASLDWNGNTLVERVRAAAREAVDETVDAARDDAKETHTWQNDLRMRRLKKGGKPVDTHLERQIKSEHADRAEPNPTAAFGYTRRRGFYGLFHEEGTVHEHMYPALRPAADRQFPTLADRIKESLLKDGHVAA